MKFILNYILYKMFLVRVYLSSERIEIGLTILGGIIKSFTGAEG